MKLLANNHSPRCREQVVRNYHAGTSNEQTADCLVLRVFVFNLSWFDAGSCQVFIRKLELVGDGFSVTESDRSELMWTDYLPPDRFYPKRLPRGLTAGRYVDICATDSYARSLQVASKKHSAGYVFNDAGTYHISIELERQGKWFSFRTPMELKVHFDPGTLDGSGIPDLAFV